MDLRCCHPHSDRPHQRFRPHLKIHPLWGASRRVRLPVDCGHTGDRSTDAVPQVGDKDHLKVFASEDAARKWLQENDPEGVAFEYDVRQ